MILGIILGVVALIAVFLVGTYNGLVKLRNIFKSFLLPIGGRHGDCIYA